MLRRVRLPADQALAGSFVEIRRADAALRRAFGCVRDEFRHPTNPKLAKPVFVDEATGVGIYLSPNRHYGDVFYRKQRRGRVRFAEGGALTFAMDARVPDLEGDRDRRDLSAVTPLVRAVSALVPDAALADLVRRLRSSWGRGHAILTLLLRECGTRGLRLDFPPRWVARSKDYRHHALVDHADRAGLLLGVRHLALAGCPTAAARFGADERLREPTPVEGARIALLGQLFADLAGRPCPARTARVVELENRYGSEHARRSTARLPARLLAGSAREAVAPLLARLAKVGHRFGTADAALFLTFLLEGALRQPDRIDAFIRSWDEAALDPHRVLASHPFGARMLDEVPREPDLGDAIVSAVVLVPSGLPGARELAERIAARVIARGGSPLVTVVGVDSVREALRSCAVGGLPCVQIRDRIVGASPRARAAYAARIGPAGEIWPSEQQIDEVLTEVMARALRANERRPGSSVLPVRLRERGRRALLRHLRRHDPEGHRDELLMERLAEQVYGATRDRLPWSWVEVVKRRALASARASSDVPPPDDGSEEAVRRLATIADSALGEAVAAALRIQEAFDAALPEGTGGPPAPGDATRSWARHHALEAAVASWSSTLDLESALSAARRVADGLAEVVLLAEAASPDQACERHALHQATTGQGKDAVVDVERFRDILDAATRWHREPDELGRRRTCSEFAQVGTSVTRVGLLVPEEDAVSSAVREAWAVARAGGASEGEALAQCLAVAEAARAAYPTDDRGDPARRQ